MAASLKEKLKALIFIPIVSRTYCDPNSYAWEHEFIAFIEQASQDRFGLKVKLPGGNVASRVLPVRIHDLEPEDIKLAERHLGFIRPVDFIYHSQGVNRPLRLRDDDLAKSGQQVVYRDQINKVANAIKEIINGLKMGAVAPEKAKVQPGEELVDEPRIKTGEEKRDRAEKKTSRVIGRKPLLWGLAIGFLITVAAILLYPKVFKRDTLENLRSSGKISIVVMPFQNLSNDSLDTFQDVIQQLLISELLNSSEFLIVKPRETVASVIQGQGLTNNKTLSSQVAKKISHTLEADVFVTGTIILIGNSIRLTAQLNDSNSEDVLNSFVVAGKVADINLTIDSLKSTISNYLIINVLKKELSPDIQSVTSSSSPEACKFFIAGNNAIFNYDFYTAGLNYEKALEFDPNLNFARIMLSLAYCYQFTRIDEARKSCQEVYDKRDQMNRLEKIWTNWLYARLFEKPAQEINYLKDLISMDDQQPLLQMFLADAYKRSHEYPKAISEIEKALEIYKRWKIKPATFGLYLNLGDLLHETGQNKKEKKLYKQASLNFPDNDHIIGYQARCSFALGDTVEGRRLMEEKYKSTLYDLPSEAEKLVQIGRAFLYYKILPDESEKYFRQALNLKPDEPVILNRVADALIHFDRDTAKGMELNEKALSSSPDNYIFLSTKAEGLFKQGKYQEALEVLKKSLELIPENTDEVSVNYLKSFIQDVERAIANQNKK
ncbi:MAG: hypothetical protein V2A67_07505 [Bacteroidota bacterium]